jgi:hypothetical protein
MRYREPSTGWASSRTLFLKRRGDLPAFMLCEVRKAERRPSEAASLFLSAFDLHRLRNIFGGQFAQVYLRFAVANIFGVPLTFGGLISQIDGAWRHGAALRLLLVSLSERV